MRAVVVLVLAVLLSACGGEEPEARPARVDSSISPTTSSAPAPRLDVEDRGSGVACLERVGTEEIGYWQSTVTSSTPVVITRAEVIGRGARVLGGLLVPVVGGSVRSSGISAWPPEAGRLLLRDVAWAERTPLVGGRFPVQRAMLPVLHLRAVAGARVDAVVLHVRAADGQTATARLDLGIRFSRGAC